MSPRRPHVTRPAFAPSQPLLLRRTPPPFTSRTPPTPTPLPRQRPRSVLTSRPSAHASPPADGDDANANADSAAANAGSAAANAGSGAAAAAAAADIDVDALLARFDAALDTVDTTTVEPSPKQKSKHKATSQREAQTAQRAAEHARRLDALAELPASFSVARELQRCSGCGAELQDASPARPGFLPREKLAARHVRSVGAAPVEEHDGDFLPTAAWGDTTDSCAVDEADAADDDAAEQEESAARDAVCQRCYRLRHYGTIDPQLRVHLKRHAATVAPAAALPKPPRELSAVTFRACLQRLHSLNVVLIYLIDLFDFDGTNIPSLRDLVGARNPIIIAANKVDLMPPDMNPERVKRWVLHECASSGLHNPSALHLVSSKRGTNVKLVLADALSLARKRRANIYVVGAANVGKSSFINHLIRLQKPAARSSSTSKKRGKKGRSKPNEIDSALTTSVIPGTTLDVIKIPLGDSISLYDTPGLIMPHQTTNLLNADDVRAVVPTRQLECTTYRLGEGKSLFIGGLARLDVLQGRPFFFTCFFSGDVTVHPGRSEDAEKFTRRHVGQLLTPPASQEAFDALGEWTGRSFTAHGEGWKRACVDVVLSGLGWIAVTGSGEARLRISTPKDVGIFTRDPLMPFEARAGVSSYTGSKGVVRRRRKPIKGAGDSDDFLDLSDVEVSFM